MLIIKIEVRYFTWVTNVSNLDENALEPKGIAWTATGKM